MPFQPTAKFIDGGGIATSGEPFEPRRVRVNRDGIRVTESYLIDTRDPVLAREATGLPAYGSPHPQDPTLFVDDILIETVGGRNTSGDGSGGTCRATVEYREADTQIDAGSGVILPPGKIYTRLSIEQGGTTRTYAFNSSGGIINDRMLNYGQGVPVLKGAFVVEIIHAMWEDQFFAFMSPRLTRYSDLVTDPKTNSDAVRLPIWEGVLPALNIIAQPRTLLYSGFTTQRGNRVMQITHRLSLKKSHRFSQQKVNGAGIPIGAPELLRVYTETEYADLWPFSTSPATDEINYPGD